MSDLLDEQHAQVGLVALDANPDLTGRVHDSVVPSPTPSLDDGWVLVYSQVAWPREGIGTSLSERQVTVTTTYVCHCVGANAKAARAIGMQVRSSLLNLRPVIDGRICGPIKEDDVLPAARDETLGAAVIDEVRTYSFTSTG